MDSPSAIRTAGNPGGGQDHVRLWIVQRGAWKLGDSRGSGEHTVEAGQFLFRHDRRLPHFATAPDTTAQVIILPGAALTPLLGNRAVTGPADAAEVRLLLAHASMIRSALADLSPAGVRAARNTLVELAAAVAHRGFDDADPLLSPSLAQAARDLAEQLPADPDLSTALLARRLNVSVRTLQRAFSATGESAAAWIRTRRLEQARLDITSPSSPSSPLSVSEIAAHWQFADSSHFSRAFKQHYGQTPAEYSRGNRVC
jgi:AraC-like DNA-binding protein